MELSAINFCREFSIPLTVVTNAMDTCDEATLRKVRFGAACDTFKYTQFITAHHLDDCEESHVLNFVRGKENYLPIPYKTHLDNDNVVVHPFLMTEKVDFDRYAKNNGLGDFIVEDETNQKIEGSRRNYIRNVVIPSFKQQKISLKKHIIKKYKEYERRIAETANREVSQTVQTDQPK